MPSNKVAEGGISQLIDSGRPLQVCCVRFKVSHGRINHSTSLYMLEIMQETFCYVLPLLLPIFSSKKQ